MAISENGVETYGGTPSSSKAPSGTATPTPAASATPKVTLPEKVDWAAREEKDPADVKVPKGSRCKRRGCGAEWDGEDGGIRGEMEGWKKSQSGEGEDCGECRYHPGGVSLFHAHSPRHPRLHLWDSPSSMKDPRGTYAANVEYWTLMIS